MKAVKKILSIALVVVMMMALGTTAFAENPTGTITLTNAAKSKTYELYKLFDATYDEESKATAYTTNNNALADALPEDIFTVVDLGGGVYGVTMKDGKSADALTWFKANAKTYGTKVDTWVANADTKTWTVPYGYYYISTTNGTILTIAQNTTAASVIDKNNTKPSVDPDPDPEDPTDSDSKKVDKQSATIGETLKYTVHFNATNFETTTDSAGNVTTKKITKYIITDTINGATLNSDIKVTVGGNKITAASAFDQNGKLTIPWVNASGESLYNSGVKVEITYSAVLTEAALANGNKADNKAVISYVAVDLDDPDPDPDPEPTPINPDTPPVVTDTYSFNLKKTDGTDVLNGAKFKLYDAAENGNEIKVVKVDATTTEAAYYRVAKTGETGVEIEAGEVTIKGLKAGTYYLEETAAPQGYNMLTARQGVVAKKGTETVTVVNTTGATLPSTGGEGTILLLTMGAVLFGGMAILLVTKKRLYNEGM